MFVHRGDGNGVFHFLGTLGKREHWVNPHKSGRVHVTCSAPMSRYTRPENLGSSRYHRNFIEISETWKFIIYHIVLLLSRFLDLHFNLNFQLLFSFDLSFNLNIQLEFSTWKSVGRSFVTTSYTSGNPQAWYIVDLKEHLLICKRYVLMSDGGDAFPRNWKFQGPKFSRNFF